MKKKSEKETSKSNMSAHKKWHESDTIKFVQLYEKAECLWNFRTPGYKNRSARDRAIQQIITEMNLPDFGVSELKNKIKNIRSTYQQEVNKIKRSKQGFASDVLEEYKTNLAWFPIADRFLSGVINSSKNPLKSEDEDISFYQQNDPAIYNLVETEMINEDAEVDEKFPPFTISMDQIKEEIDADDYSNTSLHVKRRKTSHPPLYDTSEYNCRLEEIDHPQNMHDPYASKDEWYFFGNNISCQLRSLPVERALACQKQIMDILTQERINHIMAKQNSNTEEKHISKE